MRAPISRVLLPVAVAGIVACAPARADIYTWVDKSGRVNVGNIEPPAGARIVGVQRTDPARAAAEQAAREAVRQSEVRALEERVQALQAQVSEAARQPPAPAPVQQHISVVVAAPSPPNVPEWTPSPAFYDPQPAFAGCDPSWFGCGFGWYPGIYPGVAVVTGPSRVGRRHPGAGGRPVAPPGLRPIAPPPGGVGPIPPPLIRPAPLAGSYFGRAPAAGRLF